MPPRADPIRRIGILFSGGPAPGANAVISAAAGSFLEDKREVVGFFHGYSALEDYDAETSPLLENKDYRQLNEQDLRGLRNTRGILVGTARANPGKGIETPKDVRDPDKNQRLRAVYNGLVSVGIDALVSIGGDDTLKTANLLVAYQDTLAQDPKRVRVVHVPKTIDNDYRGIDFTFGFFTAVDVMGRELANLRYDAMATSSYFVVETMGRKAGWLSYGVAIAGEANLVIAPEDLDHTLVEDSTSTPESTTPQLSIEKLADRIVDLILTREQRGKHYGTVVLAEGLVELLPESVLKDLPRDEHGHISLGRIDLGKFVAQKVAAQYEARTGKKKKLTGLQMGYESRCAAPHAFDVMLGSQLGIGAYRALVEENLDGHMVSVSGQLDLHYVPFSDLINPQTLKTEVRYIERNSDFHRLARFLETRVDPAEKWNPGRRKER